MSKRDITYQELVFAKKEKETTEDLFCRIGQQLKLLLDEEYCAVVRYDEPGIGIVVIEYDHDDNISPYGGFSPYWLTEDEWYEVVSNREKDKP